MARQKSVWITLDNGQRRAVADLFRSEDNTWPLPYQTIYERAKAGERNLERLMRPPERRYKTTLPVDKQKKVSPWRMGPALRTDRARETWEQIRRARGGV